MGLYFSRDKQRKAALLAELKNRGLTIPPELLEGTSRYLKWSVDEDGYFHKEDGVKFTPYEAQEGFIESNAIFCLFRGGRGSGKTASGAQKALRKIREGKSGGVINPDFENLKTSTWAELRRWIPWNLVIPRQQYRKEEAWLPLQPFEMVFKNKAKFFVKGVKDPSSARGPNINWLWMDEGGRDPTGLSWKIAVASVRVGKDPQAWVTTTPNFEAPWLEDFFSGNVPADVMKELEKAGSDRDVVSVFNGSIYDNENNLSPIFMASMLAAYPSGWLRRQEIFGESVKPEGSLGDRSWFDQMKLRSRWETVKKRIRYWDLAGTEKKLIQGKEVNDPDESVGTLFSMKDKNEFCIEHQAGAFVDWDGLLRLIRDTSIRDGPDVKIFVEQEPGSGGKNQVAAIDKYLKEQIPGHFGVVGWRPAQDRVELANLWFAEAAQKKVFIVDNGSWDAEGFYNQLDNFPSGRHDDKVTSVTGARLNVAPITQWKNIPFLHLMQSETKENSETTTEDKAPDGRKLLLL